MLDVFFWVGYLFAPVNAYVLLKLSGNSLSKISFESVVTVAILVFSVLGLFPLFYHLDPYRYQTGVQDQEVVLKVLYTNILSLTLCQFGMIFVRYVLRLKSIEYNAEMIVPLTFYQRLSLLFVFFICMLVFLMYLSKLNGIAILTVITDGYEDAKRVRSSMGNSFDGGAHWYKLFLYDFMTILCFTAFSSYLISKRKSHLYAFLISFSFSSFISLMAIEKAPIIWLLVGLTLVYFFVRNKGVMPWKFVFIMGVVFSFLMTILFKFFYGAESILEGFGLFVSRAFAGSIEPAYFYLEIFPEKVNYMFGRTLPNPGGIFNFEPYRYTVEVARYVNSSLFERGITGSMPTIFWGEAYVNWGYVGVVVVSFIVGMLISVLSYTMSLLNVNSFTTAVSVWMILFVKSISVTGFSAVFINLYLFAGMVLLFFVLCLRGKIIIRRRIWS